MKRAVRLRAARYKALELIRQQLQVQASEKLTGKDLLQELRAFEQEHREFNPLADGLRIHDWIKANGNVFTRSAMSAAFIAVKSLDDVRPAEPPTIISQPVAVVFVIEGDPAVFSVEATGTAPLSFQWYRDDQKLLDETKATYTMYNTDWFFDKAKFHVVIRNSAGEVHSYEAVLRVVKA